MKQTNKLITNLHNIQFVIFILYISEVFKNATTFWAENVYKELSVGPRCMNVVSMRMCTSAVFIYIENETNVESGVKKKTWWNWLHGGCMSEIILFYFPTRLALASNERTGFWVSPGCCWLVPFRVISFSFPTSFDISWRIIHEWASWLAAPCGAGAWKRMATTPVEMLMNLLFLRGERIASRLCWQQVLVNANVTPLLRP